ncbi:MULTISPECIES: GNAT family N-acetyltransferase [unclassified Thioalkalivibrio]|uniref:GNAT family N-acetyltransferase n=1 Tax=unclassified Thioalkalivibrio TaxID=2621013 RepID=UPI0003731E2B|nr:MULTISPECIES: GNAT family N-acetyltransferase [unclassified Thioalkalivibrio]
MAVNTLFRRVLALRGSNQGRDQATRWLARMPDNCQPLWVGSHPPEGVPRTRPAQAGHWLGHECDAVVFEATTPLPGDALAIAAGLLRGGGILLLLVDEPGHGAWSRRWRTALRAPLVEWVQEGPDRWPLPRSERTPFEWTPDQQAARRLLDALAPGECGVLTAARGRGKSTLLGDWMAGSSPTPTPRGMALTAPTEAAVQAVHKAIQAHLGRVPEELRYHAPAALEAAAAQSETLVVDEAAALPVDHLLRLARRGQRLVLATTTGGFEGSGQGFRLRALPALEQAGLRMRHARLETPVRWEPGDPLERWIDDLFLLGARSAAPEPQAVRWHWSHASELATQPGRLEAVAGLLADAHYRTRPSDLQRWLDDAAIHLLTLEGIRDGALFGVVLVGVEPGLDASMAEAVWAGERRPQGHFLPCVLAAQGAFDLARHPVWRIQRIAVHPHWQGRGLGQRLLHQITERARAEGIGMVGASFGLDPGLLGLWKRGGFDLLRAGLRPDPYSGRPGGVVLKAVDDALAGPIRCLAAAQARDWPAWRDRLWPWHETALARALEALFPEAGPDPAMTKDLAELKAFAERARPLEWVLPALVRQLRAQPPTDTEGTVLATALEPPIDWDDLAVRLGVSGRRGVVRRLRQAAQAWRTRVESGGQPPG